MTSLPLATSRHVILSARLMLFPGRCFASVIETTITFLPLPAVLALLSRASIAIRNIARWRLVSVFWQHLFTIPHLLPLTLILPFRAGPQIRRCACGIATGPKVVLLEASTGFVLATPGHHAIVSIVHTRQYFAIPDCLIRLLPGIRIVIPLIVGRASFVATGPMVVLLVTLATVCLALLGLHAIHPCVRSRENVTIPDIFVRLLPGIRISIPLVFWRASLVATSPMVVFLEAMAIVIDTFGRIQAIFPVMGRRKLLTHPHVFVRLLPSILVGIPLVLRRTRVIATGPMFVLSPASASTVLATPSGVAIVPISGTSPTICPNHIKNRGRGSTQGLFASQCQQSSRSHRN